jgi:outer membrane protein assembly factor BamB
MRAIFLSFCSFSDQHSSHRPILISLLSPLFGRPGKGKKRKRAAVQWLLFLLGGLASALALAGCTQNLGGSSTGWSPAAASEGVVYVGTKQGEVKALTDNGLEGVRVKWTFRPQKLKKGVLTEAKNGLQGVFHSPVIGEDLVYVSGVDGYLYAIDKRDGAISSSTGWQRPPLQEKALDPLVSGPVLDTDTDTLVVGSEDGNLYAYDAETGEPLPWSPFATGGKIWSTPVVRDGVIYVGSQDHNVYAVSLEDGQKLWQFPTGGAVVAPPLLLEDTVVIGSFDRKLYGIDARDGKLSWQFEGKNWFWAGAVANNKTVFAPSMDGNIYALDHKGNFLWKYQVGSPVVSTPVLLPRWLVVAGKDGKISVLDPNPSDIGTRREISAFFIDAEVKAPLFVLGDSVFVGAQDSTVRRIEVKGNQILMWCFHTKDLQCK